MVTTVIKLTKWKKNTIKWKTIIAVVDEKYVVVKKNSDLDSIRTLDFCDTAHCSTLPTELISQLEAGHRVGLL